MTQRVEPAAGWCETCRSWRHTHPCGREDCPCAECGQPWGAHGKFAEACGSFKVRPTEPGAPAPAQGEHRWVKNDPRWPSIRDIEFCDICTVGRRADGKNKPCRGFAPPITLREGKAEAAPAAEPLTIRMADRIIELEAELAQARAEAAEAKRAKEALHQPYADARARADRAEFAEENLKIALKAAEREAEQLRRERDEALGMLDAMQARVCELEPRWRELEQERDAAIDDTKDYMDMAQQLEAARAALAERERAAFMAGFRHGVHNCDPLWARTVEDRYAAWQATQPPDAEKVTP